MSAASGSWVLSGGTVQGGTINQVNGAALIVSSGTLDGVTVNGDWDVGSSVNGASLTVLNGLVLNGTLLVGNPTNDWYGQVNFTGTQTLQGSGEIVSPTITGLLLNQSNMTLTIAQPLLIHGGMNRSGRA